VASSNRLFRANFFLRSYLNVLSCHIFDEFRNGCRAAHPKKITRAGTGDVQQVPLGIVDFLEVGIVARGFDAFLRGDHFVVTRNDGDRTEFHAFGEMHRADRDMALLDSVDAFCRVYKKGLDPVISQKVGMRSANNYVSSNPSRGPRNVKES